MNEEEGIADSNNQTPQTPPSPEDVNSPLVTAAGMAGNVLEWYDFAIYGYFSDVIAINFFPPSDDGNTDSDAEYGGELSHGNLLRSFAVYGAAFLMRPVGGIVLGYCGDKYGRKQALVPSLFLMAVPTTLMGFLPTYQQVGSLSTALLVICRLVQGMSVGGQLPASLIYTVGEGYEQCHSSSLSLFSLGFCIDLFLLFGCTESETRPRQHWGFYGALVMTAANCGTLLGNLIGALIR